jgi:acetyl-CoA synthetase
VIGKPLHPSGNIPEYASLHARFRWDVPARFNIAKAICGQHARRTPEAPALIFVENDGTARTFSYGEMERLSSRLANALVAFGVGPGSIVAVNLPQGPETILTLIAATRIGAIFLPLAVLFGPDALRYRLEDSGAGVLITTEDGYERCHSVFADLAELRHTIVVSDRPRSHDRDFWRLVERAASSHTIRDTAADDPGLMLYTSGTTGYPKGVLHAHRMILASTTGMSFAHDLFPQDGDRMWTPADWAWAGGMNALLTTLIIMRSAAGEIRSRAGGRVDGAARCPQYIHSADRAAHDAHLAG